MVEREPVHISRVAEQFLYSIEEEVEDDTSERNLLEKFLFHFERSL